MTWTVFVALLMLWLLGVVSSITLGGFIHVLLLLAMAIILVDLIRGRRPVRAAPTHRRDSMSNVTKRTKGAAKELGGKVVKKIGRAIGSDRIEAEGRASELEGRDEKERAKTRERIKGAVEETAGEIQRRAGRILDDEVMEGKGRVRKTTGRVRKKANQ